ncbi:MAG TPA: hypothetical protein VF881_02955 [Polyangiaceae bacterium]
MSARWLRAPARRLGVVVVVYLVHLGLALGFAWPVANLLGDPTLSHPRGDLVLFEPGGLYLVEVLRLGRASLTSAARGMTFAALATLYVGLLPLGALLHALASAKRLTAAELVAAGARSFGPLSLLLGLSLVATALACVVPLGAGGLLEVKLKTALGDRGSDMAQAALWAVALALAAVIGVIHDLARAAAVSRALPGLAAARIGAEAFADHPIRGLTGWGVRGFTGVGLVVLLAWAATHVGVETSLRFAAVTALHQLAAFALVYLRADWLAEAIRHTRRELPFSAEP